MACCLACGLVRSLIQPCPSNSRMAPASNRTEIAHPSMVRIEGRRSLNVSIEVAPLRGNESPKQFRVPYEQLRHENYRGLIGSPSLNIPDGLCPFLVFT